MTWGTVFFGFKDNDWRIEPHENKTSYCIAKETTECTGSPQNSLSDSPSTILTLSGLARVVQFLGWLSSVSYSRTKPMPSSHPQAWIWMWEESPSDSTSSTYPHSAVVALALFLVSPWASPSRVKPTRVVSTAPHWLSVWECSSYPSPAWSKLES